MKSNRISLRQADEAAILDYVRLHARRSRADVARDLGMSPATAGRAVRRLLHANALREVGQGESAVGRRPTLLEYNPLRGFVVGVDLGGMSCRIALTDLQGEILYSEAVPVHQTGAEPLDVLTAGIARALDRSRDLPSPVKSLGVGVPGVVTQPGGVVSRAPNVGWEGVPVGHLLQERFGIPVLVENDVNLAALGEAWRGSAHGMTDFAAISIGTGIGAGIVVGGDLLRGRHNAAGEVGYVVPGERYLTQPHGQDGCFEALAAGPGIARHAAEVLRRDSRPSTLRDLPNISTADVFAHYKAGDWAARAVVDDLTDHIALLVINMAAMVDPELVILGGSVGLALDDLVPAILDRIEGHLPVTPAVTTSTLGGQATLLGAVSAALALARMPEGQGTAAGRHDGLASNLRAMFPAAGA